MTFIEDTQVLQVLRGLNPWWGSGTVPVEYAKPVRRLAFFETLAWTVNPDVHRAVVLSGARRVGKTTILYQLAEAMIERALPASHIMYATFDHPILKMTSLERLVEIFVSNVADGSRDLLLLLDEVHYASDWTLWLKRLVDTHPGYRIVVTGSASADLRAGSGESGVGRWLEVRVPTLSFFEYIALTRSTDVPAVSRDVRPTQLSLLSPSERTRLVQILTPLEPHFHRYLLVGGFPETAQMQDLSLAQRLLREDVVDRVLKRDMVALYNVRNVMELERLFVYLCLHSGGQVVQDRLATDLGVSRTTVANDLRYLELANLIYRLDPVGMGGKKALKPRSKVYIADPALRNAVLLKGEEVLADAAEMGLVVETSVIKHLHAFYYPVQPELGYWRGNRDREIDLVVRRPGSWEILLEVKYRNDPKLSKDDGLYQYAERSRPTAALIVTKESRHFGPAPTGASGFQPFMVPAFLFLYLLGHSEKTGYELGQGGRVFG